MNPETITKIQQKLDSLSEKYSDVLRDVRALSINEQMYLKSNNPIAPGIACKVAFDTHGLIVKADVLQQADIPNIQMDKVIGLRAAINDKMSKIDIDKLKEELMNQKLKKGSISGTATKVNFDEHGLIVSTSDLSVDDIPDIPVSKVVGLSDLLSQRRNAEDNKTIDHYTHPSISPNTSTKVSFDEHGHILKGESLSLNDLPGELLSRMNVIESRVPSLASQQTVDSIGKALINKVDANPTITAGTFTKVRVDSKGLVTSGETLTLRDLPPINIDDIPGLKSALNQKADHDMMLNINNTVNQFSSVINQVSELVGMSNILKMKADSSDVKTIGNRLQSLQALVDKLVGSLPADTIMLQLNEIQTELSNLGGRISVIEQKLMSE